MKKKESDRELLLAIFANIPIISNDTVLRVKLIKCDDFVFCRVIGPKLEMCVSMNRNDVRFIFHGEVETIHVGENFLSICISKLFMVT